MLRKTITLFVVKILGFNNQQ